MRKGSGRGPVSTEAALASGGVASTTAPAPARSSRMSRSGAYSSRLLPTAISSPGASSVDSSSRRPLRPVPLELPSSATM